MWSYNKSKAILLGTALCLTVSAWSQECSITVSGQVIDEISGRPMAFATVVEKESNSAAISDTTGAFILTGLCPGDNHIEVGHLGCETVILFVPLISDTVLSVIMHHNAHLLGGVTVTANDGSEGAVQRSVIGRKEIESEADQGLTAVLSRMVGMSAIKNGGGISKPIYHGLSGNRMTLLNDGVAQSGQMWGQDHAPEIDAFAADRMTVVNGVDNLMYNGADMGAMILISKSDISKDPHLHGRIGYGYASNGHGHTVHTRLEKGGEKTAWRLDLSGQQLGDLHTPDYLLTNTGSRQINGSLQVENEFTDKWSSRVVLSSFNAANGVLRGAQIGNATDLQTAFSRETPFFTRTEFSYDIEAPRQEVSHQMVKWTNRYELPTGQIELTYAGQLNDRQEYDVRRGGRDQKPSLDLEQIDHFFSLDLDLNKDSLIQWRAGAQYQRTFNTNDPLTGILPLIPDYLSQVSSLYLIARRAKKRWSLSAGGRLDLKNIYALPISLTIPRVVTREDLWFVAPKLTLESTYQVSDDIRLEGETSLKSRAPEVNELFSGGLHQGVSGIEEGDAELDIERSLLNVLSLKYSTRERYYASLSAYYHRIDEFIFLQPQNELRTTIRGAFPVFGYEQVDAHLSGLDVMIGAEILSRWRLTTTYAYINGQERESGLALIGIPANTASATIEYESADNRGQRLHDFSWSLNYRHVSSRTDILTDNNSFDDRDDSSPLQGQDFIAPPPAYGLLNSTIAAELELGGQDFGIQLTISNLLDTRYRDYLDRQRYFADAMGRNIRCRLSYNF